MKEKLSKLYDQYNYLYSTAVKVKAAIEGMLLNTHLNTKKNTDVQLQKFKDLKNQLQQLDKEIETVELAYWIDSEGTTVNVIDGHIHIIIPIRK